MEENVELFEKFLEGRCSKEEFEQVNRWLDQETEYGKLLHLMEQREGQELHRSLEPDGTIQEWAHSLEPVMQQRISTHERNPRPFLTRPLLRWTSIAAVFVGILILSGVFLWNTDNSTGLFGSQEQTTVAYAELANPNGIPELHRLPDGTQIWLAAGSTLKYPEPFDDKQRYVELSGEAFFDVARDEKRPFTIRTGDLTTRVLGTSFKVTAFVGQEQEISVATGKVSVSSNGQELALLTRGLQVRRNPETGETTRTAVDPAVLEQWKSGKLVFRKMQLGLVAKQLENRYGIEIEFADKQIAMRQVSGSAGPEEEITTLLRILGRAGKFQFKRIDEHRYLIY